jgi:hypothetical protein
MNELQIKHLVEGMRRLLLKWQLDLSVGDADSKILASKNLKNYGDDFCLFLMDYSFGRYENILASYEKFFAITASETGTTKNLSPFESGKQAFFDGKLLADNPYSGKDALMCGESADQWVSGWLAEKESYANCKIVRHENGKIAVSMEGLNERQS